MLKNYDKLREELEASYKAEYPLDFESGEAINFEELGDASEEAQFINKIAGDILDVSFDDIADGNEEYCQATYYSEKLHKIVVLDMDVAYEFANPQVLIDALIEYQEEADKKELTIFTAELKEDESMAKKLADLVLCWQYIDHPADSMDGDSTELLAKNFLVELNKLMGNK